MSKSAEPLVASDVGRVEVAPSKVVWLYANLAGTLLLFAYPPNVSALLVAFVLSFVTLCMGHSVGLHRGLIHKSYQCPRWLRGLLVYLFVLTGIGAPIQWMRLHQIRDHYQNSAACPRYFRYDHSCVRDYFWNLHLRFIPADASIYDYFEADERDRWLIFLDKTWPAHSLGLGVLLWSVFGLSTALICVPARVAVSVLAHWFIGFAAHIHGSVRYELEGSSEIGRNQWFLGVISFGEGFHNNHHANPNSARIGEAWYELDLGWYVLVALERCGLVHSLRVTGTATNTRRFNARLR